MENIEQFAEQQIAAATKSIKDAAVAIQAGQSPTYFVPQMVNGEAKQHVWVAVKSQHELYGKESLKSLILGRIAQYRVNKSSSPYANIMEDEVHSEWVNAMNIIFGMGV